MVEQNFVFDDIDVDLNLSPELQQLNYNNSSQYFDVDGFNLLIINDNDLRILHLNIHSLWSNMEDLCALLTLVKVKLDICITESWLSDHAEPLYSIPGDHAYHSLQPVGMRGGGLVYLFLTDIMLWSCREG